MIPKAKFFEWIEDYCMAQLNEVEKLEFEKELNSNSELRNEVNLFQEIQSAITEKDVLSLKGKLEKISKKQKSGKKGTFELLEFADIEEITENVSPEELINFYDSLPKVHVYQHELVSNENIHEFYKEQNRSGENGEEDLLDELDLEGFEEFEGLGEAVLEKDILSLREKLAQVSKSVQPQFTTEEIDKYVSGELTGNILEEFEAELEYNSTLRMEVELHREMESAILEEDILELREKLSQIIETETSWNVSEKNIEDFIEGTLEGDALKEFVAELDENTDLMAEVTLRRQVNEAIGEKDVMNLRDELKDARENAKDTEVKSIVPNTGIDLMKVWKRGAAVIILLIGLAGVLKLQFNSTDRIYNEFYSSPTWSPERSVSVEVNYLNEGNSYYLSGNFEKAIELYDLALQTENEKFVFHFYKGASLQNLDKYEEAIPEYNQVIKQGDNLYIEEAEWNKSLCYIELGKAEQAKQLLLAIVNRGGYYKDNAKAVLRRLKYLKK